MFLMLFRWKVRLGDNDLSSAFDDDSVVERDVAGVQIHPRFVAGEAYFDIAVLKIDKVMFSVFVRPGKSKFKFKVGEVRLG
jgi:hypothetical protein